MMEHRIINEQAPITPADYDVPTWDIGTMGDINEPFNGDRYMEMSDEWLGYLQWLETVEFRAGQ